MNAVHMELKDGLIFGLTKSFIGNTLMNGIKKLRFTLFFFFKLMTESVKAQSFIMVGA